MILGCKLTLDKKLRLDPEASFRVLRLNRGNEEGDNRLTDFVYNLGNKRCVYMRRCGLFSNNACILECISFSSSTAAETYFRPLAEEENC